MSALATVAANAYAAAARHAVGTAPGGAAKPAQSGEDFAALMQQALDHVSAAGARADKATLAHAAGKADLVDVVTAVAETEVAVQTLVSVRDRVISAYQEIMRMPI